LVSPYFGIRASYKNIVFETKPIEKKKAEKLKEVVTDSNQKPIVCKSEYAWLGKEGLSWKPGLPVYREVFEIVQEIFERPYGNAKSKPA
jgi:hypothetical protein